MTEPFSAGLWAKRYHQASRSAIERILRPYGIGSTQWYVLHRLIHHGDTPQRDFPALLQIEKPALSDVVRALVRKELVDQVQDPSDLRQRVLRVTPKGEALWQDLPDPIAMIVEIAFAGVDQPTLGVVASVLQTATERLNSRILEGKDR